MALDGQLAKFILLEFADQVALIKTLRYQLSSTTAQLTEAQEANAEQAMDEKRLHETLTATDKSRLTTEAKCRELAEHFDKASQTWARELGAARKRIAELEQDRAKQDARIAELTESPGT